MKEKTIAIASGNADDARFKGKKKSCYCEDSDDEDDDDKEDKVDEVSS